ncbi:MULTISPECIES: class A beta-lactamase [unclassified Janthinobacterium]|uniref:class A beta-lactamase n=1 Tax=unclassified Janthinobacterium TaxID=2610881 RepID=UPI0004764BCE|nr:MULTISPECIES: class A beta-lactamase [unclassified Janthinobacterium]MEC5161301.1 beta-lactamase class A [Janthinobacterium sp. CG_S6]
MNHSPHRRIFLLAAASVPLMAPSSVRAVAGSGAAAAKMHVAVAVAQLAELEKTLGGRLGVFALDTGDGSQLSHRAGERFAFCSTAKVMIASAILARSAQVAGRLRQRVRYAKGELVNYSPITERHVGDGMTVAELCAAGIQYSDNTSANLLIKILGGPAAVTAYARSIGDTTFRLDRLETELNSAIPGDPRDTTTPEAMGLSLRRVALGDALAPASRELLQDWLRGNTTGAKRIRAAVPADWQVGDKTGTGDYGTANDVGVVWRPNRAPVVVSIYTTHAEKDAKASDEVIAAAARIVVAWLG